MPPPRELTDDYRLEKILSSSRSGSILRASRIDTGRNVVIKLINVPAPADPAHAPGLAARFSAYATALAGIRHPNLPVILDSGVTPDGGAFLVMERLEGVGFEAGAPELAAAGGNGASPERVLPLLGQALAGLEELARRGLAHLNLCPENLFLAQAAPAAAADQAAAADSGATAPQTVKLLGLGTPLFHLGEPWSEAPCARFRPPELASPAAAQEPPGWQADCYSLALTACYALGATVASGEVAGTLVQTVQMPLALRFELANDEALREILERCLRQSPPERPAHGAIREAFRLALGNGDGDGDGDSEPVPGAVAPDVHGEGGGASPSGHGVPGGAGAARDRGFIEDPGAGHPGAPRDWRSLLSDSAPLPQLPSWQTPLTFGLDHEPAGNAGTAGVAGDQRAALAPAAAPAPAIAAAAGDDSFLDLFGVPATLPGLPEDEGPPGMAGAAFGLHLPEGFELPPAAAAFDADAHGAGYAAGLEDPAPDLDPDPVPAHSPLRQAGSPKSPPTAGAAAEGLLAAGAADALPPQAIGQAVQAAPPLAWTEAQPPGRLEPAAAAPEGELLSAVDDLLGSLPPPPPLPLVTAPPPAARTLSRLARGGRGAGGGAAPAAGKAGGGGAGAGTAPAGAAGGISAMPEGRGLLAPLLALPRPVLLAGAGVLLLAAGIAAWVLAWRGSRPAPHAPAAVAGSEAPAAPPSVPGRSAAAKFFDAKSYLIFGKESDARVRQALRELTYADQAELGAAGCRQLAAIQQVLAAAALETVQMDLATALRNGDLGALEDVVEVASDRDLPPSQHGDFARARSLVGLYRRARVAAGSGDQAQVLEQFRAMQGLSKTLRDPLELRDKAAQAIEADALALARDGKYDESVARLGPILGSWPERASTKDLVKSYQAAAASEAQQVAILDSVPTYESRRKPSVPLEMLRPLQPTPHLEQRVAETRQRLEAQLAQLDAQPPQVVLRPGYPLDYARGTMIMLSFRVTDDYEVKSVKLFARPEAGRMRELTLQKSAFGWDVEIPPSFHQNGTVELWVVATDLSGHEGYLGTKENPLRVTRRQGFQQLLH